MDEKKVEDLMAQIAAQTVRADNAEAELTELKKRADAAEGDRDTLKNKVATLEKERADNASESPAKLKEQLRAMVGKVATLEKERNDAASPEKIRAAVKARVSLETSALAVVGGDRDRFDALTDRQVMVSTIEKIDGKPVPADKSDDYVRARFDSAVENYAAGAAALERVRQHSREAANDTTQRQDARNAREKFLERQDNRWKTQKTEA